MASKRVEIILDLNDQEAMNALKAFQEQFKETAQIKEKSSKQEEQALKQQVKEQEKLAKAQEKQAQAQAREQERLAKLQEKQFSAEIKAFAQQAKEQEKEQEKRYKAQEKFLKEQEKQLRAQEKENQKILQQREKEKQAQAREQEKIAQQEKAQKEQVARMEEAERNKQLRHEEKLKFMQEAQAKAEEKEQEKAQEKRTQALAIQAKKEQELQAKRQLAYTNFAGAQVTAGVGAVMGSMTSSDASGVINALGGGIGQGINAFGGLLSSLGHQKTGSIVQTAGALVPMVGQGVAQAIGQVYSRFTEVAQYELPKMIASYRLGSGMAKNAPNIGGEFGYSMGESLSNLNAYASAYGSRSVGDYSSKRIFKDIRSSEMLGVNPMAIPQFASLGGIGGAMQNEEQMAGIARGVLQYASKKDMLGSQAEKLLGAINSGIQGMASKGLAVDAQSLTSFIIGVSNAGIKSVQGMGAVRAVQGIESIAGQAKGGYLGNFQGLAMQALQAEAASSSDGTPLGMINMLEKFQSNPRLATQIIQKRLGGTVSRLALGGAGLSQAQINALFGAGKGEIGGDFDLTGQIGDQLDVTKKLNTLERERVERNFDFSRSSEGSFQIDILLGIQKTLELMIESIGTSDLSRELTNLAKEVVNYLK
jgi:chemotaxis protein histidine kinase CheA